MSGDYNLGVVSRKTVAETRLVDPQHEQDWVSTTKTVRPWPLKFTATKSHTTSGVRPRDFGNEQAQLRVSDLIRSTNGSPPVRYRRIETNMPSELREYIAPPSVIHGNNRVYGVGEYVPP